MEKLVRAIVEPIIVDKDALMIKSMPIPDSDIVEIIVIANAADVARLIGKQGVVADAIREIVSVKSRLNDVKFRVKFESYEDIK